MNSQQLIIAIFTIPSNFFAKIIPEYFHCHIKSTFPDFSLTVVLHMSVRSQTLQHKSHVAYKFTFCACMKQIHMYIW